MLFALARSQNETRHAWRREEIEAKNGIAELVAPGKVATLGADGDVEKARLEGKTLVRLADALAVKARLEKGLSRDNPRLHIQTEADLNLAAQQRQLISLEGLITWLRGLEPKREMVGPEDPAAWANPAIAPAQRFQLVPVATALAAPGKARELAVISPELERIKKEIDDQKNLQKTALQREAALGEALRQKAFQELLPGFARALEEVFDGKGKAEAVAAIAREEIQSRRLAVEAAGKSLALLKMLGGPDDSIETALEKHIRNRVELLRALEGAYRAGDKTIVGAFRRDPAFLKLAEFARQVDSGTVLLKKVRESGLPQAKRVELVDLLFGCEPAARWFCAWMDKGGLPPGEKGGNDKPARKAP